MLNQKVPLEGTIQLENIHIDSSIHNFNRLQLLLNTLFYLALACHLFFSQPINIHSEDT